MQVKAALFDMDGLLLDTEQVSRDAFMAVAPNLADRDAFYPRLIGHRVATNRGQLAAWLGSAPAADDLLEQWGAKSDQILAAGVPLRPGVQAVIARLADAGVPMAVVTSTRRAIAEHHLAQVGLLSSMRALVGGDDVSDGKPAPEPYLTGAAKLGFAPASCAAFEDSNTGVRSALAAGCHVVQVPDLVPPDPELGVPVAPDLATAVRMVGL